jgi:hypothetical protein
MVDLYTLQLAAHRVLVAERLGRLQTRSLHAELIHYVSGSRHVSAPAEPAAAGGGACSPALPRGAGATRGMGGGGI